MRILLTGCHGQVGCELQRALAPLGDLIAVDQAECNLADPMAMRQLVRATCPAVIVNAAAYTAVEQAENERELAVAVNTVAPGVLGEEAARLGALMVHYSTDYVFDGTNERAYVEDDTTNPQSVYGRSKRDGELALQAATGRHLILRTSWVFGAHGSNFLKTILRLAAERDSLTVVADQWGAPTSAALLAGVTAQLVGQQQRARESFPHGTYHCVAAGETNWYEYARFVVSAARRAGAKLQATPATIHPVATADYPAKAKRPANSRLDTTKFRRTFDLALPHWQNGLEQVLQQILSPGHVSA